jgi:hypothetical protein
MRFTEGHSMSTEVPSPTSGWKKIVTGLTAILVWVAMYLGLATIGWGL